MSDEVVWFRKGFMRFMIPDVGIYAYVCGSRISFRMLRQRS